MFPSIIFHCKERKRRNLGFRQQSFVHHGQAGLSFILHKSNSRAGSFPESSAAQRQERGTKAVNEASEAARGLGKGANLVKTL